MSTEHFQQDMLINRYSTLYNVLGKKNAKTVLNLNNKPFYH